MNWMNLLKVRQITTPVTDINIKKVPKKKKSTNCWNELKAMHDSWIAQTTLIHPSIIFTYMGKYTRRIPPEEIACAFLEEIRRYQLTASNKITMNEMQNDRVHNYLPLKGAAMGYDPAWTYNIGWYYFEGAETFTATLYHEVNGLKRVYWRLMTIIKKHPQAPFVMPPGNIMNNMWAALYDLHHDEPPTINKTNWVGNPLDDSDTDKLLAVYFDWRK